VQPGTRHERPCEPRAPLRRLGRAAGRAGEAEALLVEGVATMPGFASVSTPSADGRGRGRSVRGLQGIEQRQTVRGVTARSRASRIAQDHRYSNDRRGRRPE
jgi:hypothetical protein